SLVFLGGVVFLSVIFASRFPNVPDIVLFFLACSTAVWSFRNFSDNDMKYFLPPLLLLGSEKALYVWQYVNNPDMWKGATQEQIENATHSLVDFLTNYFMVSIVPYSMWFMLWCSTSFWAFKVRMSLSEFRDGITLRGHILKFCIMIVAPAVSWVQATYSVNFTESVYDINFGQIFSLVISGVTVITLIDEMIQVKRSTWAAVFFSRKMPQPNMLEEMMNGGEGRHGFGAEASVAPMTRRAWNPEPEIQVVNLQTGDPEDSSSHIALK
ncbi:hypothetical protein FA15DRAFT_733013, partial [Coprinopsis marcescibilis]